MGKTIKQFADEMSIIMPRLFRQFVKRQARVLMTEKISFPQIAILITLKEKGQCMMSEIARSLAVTTSAATGTVDRMVRAGFLSRRRDPNDRRVVNIQITQKGKKAINAIFKHRQEMMVKIFRNFTPRARENYLNTVKKIHTILAKGKK